MNRLLPPRSRSVTFAGVLALATGGSLLVMIGLMLWQQDGPQRDYPDLRHKIFGVLMVLGCVSVVTVIGGFGILCRRNWARILTMIVSAPWILFAWYFLKPLLMLHPSARPNGFMFAPYVFSFAAAVAWLALLAGSEVRTGFLPPAVVQIYVNLLDGGTLRSRPAKALAWGNGLFELLPTKDYDPKVERWEFLPGSFVHGTKGNRDGEPHLIAVSLES